MNVLSRIFFVTVLTLGACGDERRPTGDNCGEDGPCEGGICVQDRCIDPEGDEDNDGVINRIEAGLGSDAFNADSDGDNILDPDELGPNFTAIDTDGDGIADILESAIADDDDDCIPNQYDAENTTPNGDLSPLVPVLCPTAGVCGADGAVLAVVCSDGFATAACDFAGVPEYAASEGPACDERDNNCDGQVDEGLDCTPDIPPDPPAIVDFHFLVPGWSLEQNMSGAILIPRSEYISNVAIAADRLTVSGGCLSDAFMRVPVEGLAAVQTFLRCNTDVEEIPFTLDNGAINIAVPAGEETNDFDNIERVEAYSISLQPTTAVAHPRLGDVLFGQTIRRYIINPDTRTPTVGREISGFTAIRKADGMTANDLIGDWGFVGLFVSASGITPSVEYNGGIFPASFVLRDGNVLLDVRPGLENIGIQTTATTDGGKLAVNTVDSRGEPDISVNVSESGTVRIGGEDGLFGAVSPAFDFAAFVGSPHDLSPAVPPTEPVIDNDVTEAAYQFLVGVRRDATPLATVAGHAYRVMHYGYEPGFAAFGVFFAGPGTTLEFGPDGTDATYVNGETAFIAPFSDVISESVEAATPVSLSVSATDGGRIVVVSNETRETVANGFVAAGGRKIVLMTTDTTRGELDAIVGARFGLMMAICTNCN